MKSGAFGRRWWWPLLIGLATIPFASRELGRRHQPVAYAEARSVVDRRCVECHSERPTNRAFPIAPRGVVLDTGLQMKEHAPRIEARVAVERTMPLANMSHMTDDERQILSRWIATGARLP